MDIPSLRELLRRQTSGLDMSDELYDRFVGAMTEIRLRNKEVLIPYGKCDANLYVQRNGILRACYFDGENERTYGFADPGTVTVSYHTHFAGRPSVFQIESCGETDVLKLAKRDLDVLLAESHEFTRWLLTIHEAQCYFNEIKHVSINGSVRERYLALVEKRPEVLARVSFKVIASYLGVAPNYLHALRKQLWEERQL